MGRNAILGAVRGEAVLRVKEMCLERELHCREGQDESSVRADLVQRLGVRGLLSRRQMQLLRHPLIVPCLTVCPHCPPHPIHHLLMPVTDHH